MSVAASVLFTLRTVVKHSATYSKKSDKGGIAAVLAGPVRLTASNRDDYNDSTMSGNE